MPAVAITDHGNLFGAIEFYQCAKAAGIKPIIGCEAYITAARYKEKPITRIAAYHFTLLAERRDGLSQSGKADFGGASGWVLLSAAHRQGSARGAFGRFDRPERLSRRRDQHALFNPATLKKRRIVTAEYRDIFGPRNFFIELHDHGMAEQKQCNAHLPKFAREFGLGLVAANDVHFLGAAITERTTLCSASAPRENVKTNSECVMSRSSTSSRPQEMREIFPRFPGGDHEHAGDRRPLQSRNRVREIEISRVSGAGRQNARRLSARALLQGSARALRRTRSQRSGTNQATRLRSRCSGKNRVSSVIS